MSRLLTRASRLAPPIRTLPRLGWGLGSGLWGGRQGPHEGLGLGAGLDAALKLSVFQRRQDVLEGRARAGAYHTVGMFSLIDALLDRPMEELLSGLNLSREINDALTGREENRLSRCLELVKAYETGRWERVADAAATLGIDTDLLPLMFVDALERCRCLETVLD